MNENERKELKKIGLRFETYLPEFILKAPYLDDIFKNEILESYYLNKYAENLFKELAISTAKKSINKWEIFAGISNENLELEERIKSVINKFSNQIHANYFNFLSMLRTIDNKTELKEIINEYRIIIKTYTPMDYANIINFINMVHSYKPAHIGFNLEVYREIYKKLGTALIIQNVKNTNIIIKPYSDKALTNLYNGVAINKVKKIGVNIKVVTGEIQRLFFTGVLVNKVNFKEINFKNLDDFRAVSSNGIVVNKVRIRRCNIE